MVANLSPYDILQVALLAAETPSFAAIWGMHLRPPFHHFLVQYSIYSPLCLPFHSLSQQTVHSPGQFSKPIFSIPANSPTMMEKARWCLLRKRRQEHLVTGQYYILRKLWVQEQLTGLDLAQSHGGAWERVRKFKTDMWSKLSSGWGKGSNSSQSWYRACSQSRFCLFSIPGSAGIELRASHMLGKCSTVFYI